MFFDQRQTPHQLTTLDQLPRKSRARIEHLPNESEFTRLAEMGLMTGTEVTVFQSSSSVIIDFRGTRLAVSGDLARKIKVKSLVTKK